MTFFLNQFVIINLNLRKPVDKRLRVLMGSKASATHGILSRIISKTLNTKLDSMF